MKMASLFFSEPSEVKPNVTAVLKAVTARFLSHLFPELTSLSNANRRKGVCPLMFLLARAAMGLRKPRQIGNAIRSHS